MDIEYIIGPIPRAFIIIAFPNTTKSLLHQILKNVFTFCTLIEKFCFKFFFLPYEWQVLRIRIISLVKFRLKRLAFQFYLFPAKLLSFSVHSDTVLITFQIYVAGRAHSIQKGYLHNNKHSTSLDLPSTDKLHRNKKSNSVCLDMLTNTSNSPIQIPIRPQL